jgi:hypothetical protein
MFILIYIYYTSSSTSPFRTRPSRIPMQHSNSRKSDPNVLQCSVLRSYSRATYSNAMCPNVLQCNVLPSHLLRVKFLLSGPIEVFQNTCVTPCVGRRGQCMHYRQRVAPKRCCECSPVALCRYARLTLSVECLSVYYAKFNLISQIRKRISHDPL